MKRVYYQIVIDIIKESRKFIQIVEGPRQVGKSTMVKQILKAIDIPWLHFAADGVPANNSYWISACWQTARTKMQMERLTEMVLVIDEIQRLKQWSDVVKKEWDADTFNDVNIKLVLLGSSRVRLEKGLSESLKGRFEVVKMPNWSFEEMQEAFGMSMDEYMFYGGYPGAAGLVEDSDRWRNYISGAIVDATINNDILMDTPISKPALLKQTFELASAYSGQLLSLTKLQGQLMDAGNTTTLSGYLELLDKAGMVCGLQKYAVDKARRRASIPKFQVYNNALMNLYSDMDFQSARSNHKVWGRIFESAIGAHIVNCAYTGNMQVYYWREGDKEVDFVLVRNSKVVAIEVKSSDEKNTAGLQFFEEAFHPYRSLVVGKGGLPAETFLKSNLLELFT